jgi:signal transduction histidine kinase
VQIKNYLGVPIFEEGHIVVIAAVANKTGTYTQNDTHIITSIINDMWRMIQRKKFEHEREQNISKLTVMNEKLRIIGSLTRHNVGNKLSVIETNAYLLRKHIDPNSQLTKYFDSINSTIASSRRLFEYSYHYSRIGNENLSNINVEKCFNEVIPHFTTLKNITVSNQTNGLTVVADSLLTQIFYNLIENSLKHGKKVTHIKLTYKKQEDTNQIHLIYEDDGVGIPDENKPRLYTEGFSTAQSTGLGLPLTKKIVEFYGWTITEQGTPGNGAKFVITIPTKQP